MNKPVQTQGWDSPRDVTHSLENESALDNNGLVHFG